MTCEVCTPGPSREAKIFILVTQDGHNPHRAHVCMTCFELLSDSKNRYKGLTVQEISQQEFNQSPK